MKIAIIAQHYQPNEEIERYVHKKLDKLARYVPRHARDTLHADVHLAEQASNSTNRYSCEVILRLPHGEIIAKEATINMFAAIDIVEAKVKNQLLKYKQKNSSHTTAHSRIWRRLRRGTL